MAIKVLRRANKSKQAAYEYQHGFPDSVYREICNVHSVSWDREGLSIEFTVGGEVRKADYKLAIDEISQLELVGMIIERSEEYCAQTLKRIAEKLLKRVDHGRLTSKSNQA